MKFSGVSKVNIDRVADAVLARVLEDPDENAAGKLGVKVRIRCAHDPTLGRMGWYEIYTRRVGSRPNLNWDSVEGFSWEKAERLEEMNALNSREVSSFQSRNVDIVMYGGAILLRAHIPELGGWVLIIISTSGLSEKADETFGLLLAKEMGWGDREQYATIIGYSSNSLALRFLM